MPRTTLESVAARKSRLLTTSAAVLLGVAFMAGTLVDRPADGNPRFGWAFVQAMSDVGVGTFALPVSGLGVMAIIAAVAGVAAALLPGFKSAEAARQGNEGGGLHGGGMQTKPRARSSDMKRHHPAPTDLEPEGRGTLASMCLALVLVVASVSSVNLALTGISIDLGTTSSQLTWIADGYTVALAALVLPFGALGDRFGRRSLLLIGTVVFGLAALGAAMAQSPEALIGCRVLMGIGAAMIMPGTLSTITAVFPASQRSRAVSIWAAFATSGAIMGMLGCGLLLEWSTWRATFVGTAIVAAAAFVAALKLAPNTSDPGEAVIDVPGFVLSGIGIGALVYGIVHGAEAGWTSGTALASLAVAAAALTSFVVWELRVARPMLDVRLFGLRGFSTGTLALTVQFLCLYGFFFVGLQFLQLTLGYSALRSAAGLLPMAAIVMPMSKVAPRLVDRLGQRSVMASGLLFLGGGLGLLSRLDAGSTYWQFLCGLGVFGFGMALTSTPSTTAIVASLPRAKQGVASAMNDVSRELGSALGIAILGSLFSSGYRTAIGGATGALPPEAAHAVEESAGAGLAVASELGASGRGVADSVHDAFAAGLADAMVAGAVIAVAAALFTLWRAPGRSAPSLVDVREELAGDLTTMRFELLPEPVG